MHANISPYLFVGQWHQNMAEDKLHMNDIVKRPTHRAENLNFGCLSAMGAQIHFG